MSFFVLENKIREINGLNAHFRTAEKLCRQVKLFDSNIINIDIANKLFKDTKDRFKYVKSAIVSIRKDEYQDKKIGLIVFSESEYHLLPYSQKDIDTITKHGDWVAFMGEPEINPIIKY